jgi:hypothetical protein
MDGSSESKKVQVEVRMHKDGAVSRPVGAKQGNDGGLMALIARKTGRLSARLRDKEGWRTMMAHEVG